MNRSFSVGARLLDAPYLVWVLLALPAVFMTYNYVQGTIFYGELLHATGELGARLLIAAMAVTPLRLMFPNAGWVRWLMRRRRYLGVAAFGYSLLHAAVYLERQADFASIVEDALEIAMWTGWLALLVMLALAATSNDASLRLLRRGWKWLHRCVYAAAALTFAHWILSAFDPVPAAVHLGILAALEGVRLWKTYLNPAR
ncbi:MAG TPA: ferric reductase-like transmembrane domain-containing protein [Gammaproteobacteria bacterium]|nr:ferric reductase-like transmembrane domain-containing protein [Gammaproteobacteria bacterium]